MTDPQKLAPSSQLIWSVSKKIRDLVTHVWLHESSLFVLSLSSHWLSGPFPNTKHDLVTRVWLHVRQFPRFHFEFSLAIRSVSKTKRNSVSCVWLHVSSLLVFTLSPHWLLVTFVWILIGRCDYFGFSIFDTESKFTLLQTQLRHWLDFLLLFGFVFGILDISA